MAIDLSYRELALQYAQTSHDVYETLLSGGWIYMKDGLLHCKKPIYRYINQMWALQEIVDIGKGDDDIIIPDDHDSLPGLHTALLERSVSVALLLKDGKTPTFPLMIQADKEYRPEELEKLRPQRELQNASTKQHYTLEKLLKTAEQEQITAGRLALLFDLELGWVIFHLEAAGLALNEAVKGRLLPEVEEAIRAVGCEPQMDYVVGPTILNEAITVLCNQVGIKP